jgi:hypothetical protein
MAGENIVSLRNKNPQSRRGAGIQPAWNHALINCRATRAARVARMRYQNMFSPEEKEIMGRVQEEVLIKNKNMTHEEIMWSMKEWVPNLGKYRRRDTNLFCIEEFYCMMKKNMARDMTHQQFEMRATCQVIWVLEGKSELL